MARKAWASLSAPYRARLQRGGITETAYREGRPLTAARGHAATPERPVRALSRPVRYERYIAADPERIIALAHTPAGRRRLEAYNRGAKVPIDLGHPPGPGEHGKIGYPTFAEARAKAAEYPPGYRRVNYQPGGGWQAIVRREDRRFRGVDLHPRRVA
jgi:hypothetical protein